MALKDVKAQQEKIELDAQQREYLDAVLPDIYNNLLPDVPRTMATELAIIEFAGDGDPFGVTADTVRFCLENPGSNPNDTLRARLGQVVSPKDQKIKLIEEIADLLSFRDPASLANEVKRMAWWSIDALIRRKAEIEAAQANAGKSREQLSNEVRAQRSGYEQFEPLPAHYTPPGKPDCPVPWSKQLLNKLGETGYGKNNALRILLRKHGPDQLNEAIRLTELRKGAR